MDLLEGLNPQQRQAVTAPPGPILVLAGPGSGKTRVLTHRIAYLVQELGVPASQIMAVTFTNKAARAMRSRLETLVAPASGREAVSLGTFHALCARMLRREAERLPFSREFVIFDDADQLSLIRQSLKEMNLDPKQVSPGQVLALISRAKNELIEPEDFAASSYIGEVAKRTYQRYQQLLLQNNALDFDDLLLCAVRLVRDHEDVRLAYRRRFPHLLVDEFQDTNTVQYQWLRLLAGDQPDLYVVGDADQSIYRWRGADVRNVRRFQEDYPQAQVFLLEQNYRSTQTILDAAMGVIDRQPGRPRKQLFTDRGQGELVTIHEAYDEADEAQYVIETLVGGVAAHEWGLGDVAVMYRTNAQSRSLEEAFLRHNLAYRLVGAQRFYGRREIKDLIAYLRLIHNPSDQVSLLRVLNTPPRGLGAKTIETLLALAEQHHLSPASILNDLSGSGSAFRQAFGTRPASALAEFGQRLAAWHALTASAPVATVLESVLRDVRYREFIHDGTEEGEDRWANVEEFLALAQEDPDLSLEIFLENVALVSDQDTLTDSQNAPTLLTLHAAKGLEFPVVFIVGLDDGLLPHQRSYDDPEAMAEERRLFYVGLTRAMNRLFLVRAFRRHAAGSSSLTEASRFLGDLPADRIDGDAPTRLTRAQAVYERQTRWEGRAPTPIEARYRAGMRVRHRSFGEGMVLESRMADGDEELTVQFELGGLKWLAASLAQLEILDG
jgi:DNA helicase-2/ATP-dependent DNA helicase PcrA